MVALGKYMTFIDLVVTRSKVKVTRVTYKKNVNMVFTYYLQTLFDYVLNRSR